MMPRTGSEMVEGGHKGWKTEDLKYERNDQTGSRETSYIEDFPQLKSKNS